jgi:hydroxymethylglutaryl-CoA lyase
MRRSLERFKPVCVAALGAGLRVRGYISCVLGCPYSGQVAPSTVTHLAEGNVAAPRVRCCIALSARNTELLRMGCYEISLGDSIGVGTAGRTHGMMWPVLCQHTQVLRSACSIVSNRRFQVCSKPRPLLTTQ